MYIILNPFSKKIFKQKGAFPSTGCRKGVGPIINMFSF